MHNDRVTGRLRTLTLAGAGCTLALTALTSCGGDDDGAGATYPGTASPSAGEDSAGAAGEEAAYLPVPDGVELTAPGSELKIGDSAVVAWQPRQDEVGVAEIKLAKVERTTFAKSFEGYQIKGEMASKVPYFVRVRIANEGDIDLGRRTVPLYAHDNVNSLVEQTVIRGDFTPCPDGALPKKFAGGEKAQLCLIYLVEEGRELDGVEFQPIPDVAPISWTGKVTKPDAATGKKSDRGAKPGDGPSDKPSGDA